MEPHYPLDNQPPATTPFHRPRPPRKGTKKTSPRWLVYALAALALLFAFTIAATPAPSESTSAAPAVTPAPIVKEVEVEVEVTPTSCIIALDKADQGFMLSSESLGFAADGFFAASEFDINAMEVANEGLVRVTDKVNALAPEYRSARDECRAAG